MIIKFLKDILFPKKCYSCKKEGLFLCKRCFERFKNKKSYCYICKQNSDNFDIHLNCKSDKTYYDKIIVLSSYKNVFIKKLIKDAKFYGKKDILQDLGFYIGGEIQKSINLDKKEDFLLLPCPIHWKRRLKRGYNQTEILSNAVSSTLGIDLNSAIILKNKNSRQQSHLSKQEREKNLLNSFKVNKKYSDMIDKKTVILIDDVSSTGATINEISKLLKLNGAKQVIGAVIASD